MTTTDTTDPWCDKNDTSIAVGDWVLVDDARGNPTIQRVDALVFDALGPHLRLHNDDDPPPGHVIRLDPFPADAEEPDWFHDSIGGRWIGPVGDGTILAQLYDDELALLQAAMAEAAVTNTTAATIDLNDLDGPKMVRETACVAQVAIGNFYGDKPDMRRHIDRLSRLANLCDQHRPLGPDGKHGTTRCTPTCGCIDKRTEPDMSEDWSNWPKPRDRNRWKSEVRDRWLPWLRSLPHATTITGNGGSFWSRAGEADNGVSFWTSGLNTVSDTVLCKLHDDFEVYETPVRTRTHEWHHEESL